MPTSPVHIRGDLTFVVPVWPHDAARPLVWREGADAWFWFHLAQALVFAALALLAFGRLAQATRPQVPGAHPVARAGRA